MEKVIINKLKLLMGSPIEIGEGVTIIQPKLRLILDDDQNFYSAIWQLCSASYDMPALFDDMGIDYMEVDDWMYFRIMSKACPQSTTAPFLGELDLTKFEEMGMQKENGEQEIVLYDKETDTVITEDMYKLLVAYLREMIGFQHKNRKPANSFTKKFLIEDDRKQRYKQAQKEQEEDNLIFDIVMSLVNTEELFYTYESIFDLTLYQLLKSFTQVQGKKSAVALMQGSMSGFVDTKGIPAIDMTWTYSEEKYKRKDKALINKTVKSK